jgi:acetoin utilization protein AcuB
MTPNPIVLRSNSDPLAGVAICKSGGFCRLPIVDEDDKLVGIVTKSDLELFLAKAPSPGVIKRQHRVEQVMSTPVISVPPDYPLEEAARLMLEHGISGLPVIDRKGRPVGIITQTDIFAQLAETLGANTDALRVTVRVPNRAGEYAKLAGRIAGTRGNISSIISHHAGEPDRMDLTLRVEDVKPGDLLEAIRADPGISVLHVWDPSQEEAE